MAVVLESTTVPCACIRDELTDKKVQSFLEANPVQQDTRDWASGQKADHRRQKQVHS